MSRKLFRGIAATTHRDKHDERFAKEALINSVEVFHSLGEPLWCYWNHQTTLPPIQMIYNEEIEKRSDGEYQIVVDGVLFEEGGFENIASSEIVVPLLSDDEVYKIFPTTEFDHPRFVEILYDPRNFEAKEANDVIESLNEFIPTQPEQIIRKAELPQPVLYVVGSFLTGFIARFGEMTAEKALDVMKDFIASFRNRFEQLLATSKSDQPVDIIFRLPIHNTNTVVEGAVEGATKEHRDMAWDSLPELYVLSYEIINRNRKDIFSHIKFLFNPSTGKWEVNYLLTRKNFRAILGPRYSDSSHPLRKRWEDERHNYNEENLKNVGMSIGFVPTEIEYEKKE